MEQIVIFDDYLERKDRLTLEVNKWLGEHPKIKITKRSAKVVNMTTASGNGIEKITIIIFYIEKPKSWFSFLTGK